MAEDTDGGQNASQNEALAAQLAAFKEELLGDVKTLIAAQGKGDGQAEKPEKPDGESEKPGQGDDDTPGWFRRLLGGGKKAGGDDKAGGEPEKKPDERPAGEKKPDDNDADETPPWALAIAKKLDLLEQQQGHGLAARRAEVLDGLHVRPEARQLVPKVDWYTEEGRAAAEKWASENEWALTVRRPKLPAIKLEDLPEPGAYGPPKEEMARVLASVRPEDWRV